MSRGQHISSYRSNKGFLAGPDTLGLWMLANAWQFTYYGTPIRNLGRLQGFNKVWIEAKVPL